MRSSTDCNKAKNSFRPGPFFVPYSPRTNDGRGLVCPIVVTTEITIPVGVYQKKNCVRKVVTDVRLRASSLLPCSPTALPNELWMRKS